MSFQQAKDQGRVTPNSVTWEPHGLFALAKPLFELATGGTFRNNVFYLCGAGM